MAAVIDIIFMIGFPFLDAGMITGRFAGGDAIGTPDGATAR
jgi:hypothetical protein